MDQPTTIDIALNNSLSPLCASLNDLYVLYGGLMTLYFRQTRSLLDTRIALTAIYGFIF